MKKRPSKREYPDQPLIGVGVIVFKGDQFLLIRRGKEPGKGIWTLPGGMIELGETMEQSAVREVKEECSINIRVGKIVHIFDLIDFDENKDVRYHYVIVDFVGEYINGVLSAGSDVEEAQWFALHTLDGCQVPERTKKLVKSVYQKRFRKSD